MKKLESNEILGLLIGAVLLLTTGIIHGFTCPNQNGGEVTFNLENLDRSTLTEVGRCLEQYIDQNHLDEKSLTIETTIQSQDIIYSNGKNEETTGSDKHTVRTLTSGTTKGWSIETSSTKTVLSHQPHTGETADTSRASTTDESRSEVETGTVSAVMTDFPGGTEQNPETFESCMNISETLDLSSCPVECGERQDGQWCIRTSCICENPMIWWNRTNYFCEDTLSCILFIGENCEDACERGFGKNLSFTFEPNVTIFFMKSGATHRQENCNCYIRLQRARLLRNEEGWHKASNRLIYKLFNTSTKFNDAQKDCQSFGGNIISKGIRDGIFKEVCEKLGLKNDKIWTGYNDIGDEGVWKWIDTRKTNSSGVTWLHNQPDNSDNDDCGVAWVNGCSFELNDVPCVIEKPYICEI